MLDRKRIFGSFEKVEEQDDGTIKVYGYASSEAKDSDGETIKAAAMADALPDYLSFGAVREMHQPKAAGTALEAEVQADGRTWFGAHVVDAEAVKKVRLNVYKGFSIGGKVTKRDAADPSVITGIKLVEVSLVDRPANPDAVYVLKKVEDDDAPADATPLKKGLYAASHLCELFQSLCYLQQDAAWEADMEGDGSEVPSKLKALCIELAAVLMQMIGEETAEALKAEAATGLQKKGAKFSKQTAAALKEVHSALGEMHKAMGECYGKVGGMGWDNAIQNDDGGEDDVAADAKSADPNLTKGGDPMDAATEEALAKNAELSKALDATKSELAAKTEAYDALQKSAAELEETAKELVSRLNAKGSLHAVSKSADNEGVEAEKPKNAVEAMKKVHQSGGTLVTATNVR